LLPPPPTFRNLWCWSADGKFILFTQPNRGTNWDLMVAPAEGSRLPVTVVATPANEFAGLLSPDMHWLLYGSDESGRGEVYVRSYPLPGFRKQLTTTGWSNVSSASVLDWSADGREVVVGSTDVVAYPIQQGPTLGIGAARRLFAIPAAAICIWPTADHQRFLMSLPLATASPPQLAVETNWAAALRAR
jgi:hypothetical protein